LEFNEDHSMTMKYDEASIDKFVEKLLEQRIPVIEQQYDASIDEILAANGLTMESWKQAEFANAKESLQKENEEMMKKDFQWSYSDHKIYLGSERSNYMEVDGDTMHFVMEEETEVPDNELGVSSDAILSLFDNVEFTRVD
ncbi:MAG: hypothetical protein IKT68_00220, partial [Clostridia bacterium]|nr:hypothetical protein [Clostridia bacterium]